MEKAVHLPDIERMPDRPKALPIDWQSVAARFHNHVMNDENKIMFLDEKGHIKFGAFYQDGGHELITFGGIVLGKVLSGEDVREYFPSLLDYFNDTNGMFFNQPKNKKEEYWYLMYVNCLAAEIIRQSGTDDEILLTKVEKSLERLIRIAKQVNYNFNDQGYDFELQQPFTNKDDFRQPDTIGAYAYLMLLGYYMFSKEHYLCEAVKGMELYQGFEHNPWYEIPSGAMACLATAKLNSMGYSFDVEKVVNFALDSKEGCLHVGSWGEREVNGLMMGWRGHSRVEALQTSYSLESFLLLPFLLPVVKYDHRFARLVGKYALNVSSNVKLFFKDFMPLEAQSRPDLPPDVPYETVHIDKNGHSPYAFGDFHSHKSVYGGSLLLWIANLIEQTKDPYILKLNLTRSDFFNKETNEEVFLYFNPLEEEKEVVLQVDNEVVVTDMLKQITLGQQSESKVVIKIPSGDAVLIRVVTI